MPEGRKAWKLRYFAAHRHFSRLADEHPSLNHFEMLDMSSPQEPKPAKLVIGLLMKDRSLFEPLTVVLASRLGSPDVVSSWMSFDYTAYYESELGSPLYRRLLTFETLIEQQELAAIKLATNRLEHAYSRHCRRRVNIDPGYLLYERFVLASGKNFAHRIYIGHCIYADLTLIYRKGAFETLPWTYPDYADKPIRSFLERVRKKYAVDLKKESFATRTRGHKKNESCVEGTDT